MAIVTIYRSTHVYMNMKVFLISCEVWWKTHLHIAFAYTLAFESPSFAFVIGTSWNHVV